MPDRIIKAGVVHSETLADLSAEAERLWFRLTVVVDDFGRYHAKPMLVRSACFAAMLDRVTDAEVGAWLDELDAADLIDRYIVDGRPYLQVTTWAKHQRVRAEKSKFPPADTCGQMPADASNRPQAPATAGIRTQARANAAVSESGSGSENGSENGSGSESGSGSSRAPDTAAPVVVSPGSVDSRNGVALLPHNCPRDLVATPGMVADLVAIACNDPPVEVDLYAAHYASTDRRETDWTETGRVWPLWVARHRQMGCAVRRPTRGTGIGVGGSPKTAGNRAAALAFVARGTA